MRSLEPIITSAAIAVIGSFMLAVTPARRPSMSIHADSAAVATVVAEFHRALSSGDSTRALSLLGSDAVILESGEIETRSEYRSHHLQADIEFARAVASTRGRLTVTLSGSSAWTAGTSTARGEFKGRTINSTGVESMVLTKGKTGWRIRSIHWSSRKRE